MAYSISMSFCALVSITIASAQDDPYRLSVEVGNLEYGQQGKITIEVHPDWAPKAAKRFRSLFEQRFFDDGRFFKVSPGFMAKLSMGGDSALLPDRWSDMSAPEDIRKVSNTRGRLIFAHDEDDTPRSSHIIVNINDNVGHDSRGLVPFAEIVEGIFVIDRLYAGYSVGSASPTLEKIVKDGKKYLQQFPKMSQISKIEYVGSQYASHTTSTPSELAFWPFFVHVSLVASVIISGGWGLLHLTMPNGIVDKGLILPLSQLPEQCEPNLEKKAEEHSE